MLLNYFKVALRNFLKNKVHTFINIFGLAFGIACVFLITLYLKRELSYDRFHQGAGNLYRITWEDDNPQTRTPHPMAQALAKDFPEVESAVSLTPLYGSGLTKETHSFRNLENDERFDETGILAVDTTFFDVFSFPLVRGDPKTALHHINGLLISESVAKKYFDDADPIGKHLAVDSDTTLVEVVAVFKDVPQNAHFHFDFLVTYMREKYFDPEDEFYTWRDFGHFNYIRLIPGADPKKLEGSLMEWSKKYLNWSKDDYDQLAVANYGFRVQQVTDIHLTSHLRWELESNGNMDYVYILAAAALLTLAIACVNFMNLTTAKSAERAKEIGIRKSLGAFRQQLAMQFISESVLISLAAVFLAVLLVELSLPWFNAQTGASLEVSYLQYTAVLLGLGIFVGIASGIYPSLYLSSAKPVAILKGTFSQRSHGTALRDVLIAFQFAISMALISGSFIIFSQLDFLKGRNLGFNQEGILVVPVKNEALSERFEPLRNELLKIQGIKSVSATSNIPGKQFNQNPISSVQYPEANLATSECMVDMDFFDVLGITLKEGRLFSRDHLADSSQSFILNETAANQLNVEQPVGSEINWDRDGSQLRGRVIGVVNDFHFQSLHEPMRPLLFTLSGQFNFILVKTDLRNFASQITAIEKLYRQFDPVFDFEFSFLDDQLQQQYLAEERLGKVIGTFSVIAVIIACFGLFAMALLTFYQKIKEISVRKILGASLFNLLYLLLKNFTVLVIVAGAVATPVTWWIMDRWLENFSFRITVEPLVFILSGITLIAVCWSTLGFLTVKTARLNPAETLRRE